MSLIHHGFFPRSRFGLDLDLWPSRHLDFGTTNSRLSTLDWFDPFDELDLSFDRNFRWLHKPRFNTPLLSKSSAYIPEKYRVTVDCTGFTPNSIKTDVIGNKVHVSAREEDRIDSNNFSVREFKKIYDLPVDAEVDRLASFVSSNGQLVIEAPLRSKSLALNSTENSPKVSEDGRSVSISLSLPENIDPSKISVTCKDRDLIIKAEEKVEKPDRMSHYSYYRRTTLPENTDFNAIKCVFERSQLLITAPLIVEQKNVARQIPVQSIQ